MEERLEHLKLLGNLRIKELLGNSSERKSCSKRKKLIEIREVAKKLPSNLWKALASVIAEVRE